MTLQFGSTTRLRHIDFPEASTECALQTWEQNHLSNGSVWAVKPPIHGHQTHNTNTGSNERLRNPQEKGSLKNIRQEKCTRSLSLDEYKNETNLDGANNCDLAQQVLPQRTILNTATSQQTMWLNLNIECDVLDSFTEFATFLELQNPICPAHLVDTPEKLISVLSSEL